MINKLPIYLSLLLTLFSCHYKPSAKQKEDSYIRSVSDSYKPPFFAPDNRVEKIKEIAPAIQQLIEEHARDRNILGEIEPLNQLRGNFKLNTENGTIDIFFTLTPEKNPKVQYLNMSFHANESMRKNK